MPANVDEIKKILDKRRKTLESKQNVVGVGIGYKIVNGETTDELCIICSVTKKIPTDQISARSVVPQAVDGVITDVVEVGEIVAFQDPQARLRPAPGGASVGHVDITAGTLGCWVKKDGEYYVLSNNHVLANQNNAEIGDSIIQPGPYDSGTTDDKIATLSKFIPIDWKEDNHIDAAIAKVIGGAEEPSNCPIAGFVAGGINTLVSFLGMKTRMKPVIFESDIVDENILNIGKPVGFAEATLGMDVQKMGRTTGYTMGKIIQVHASVTVGYDYTSAYFVDQLIAGPISAGGDSGSVVLNMDNKIVGLLFAGSDRITILNPIQYVIDALGFTL